MARLAQFFELHRASGTAFEFEDPATGESIPNCRFGQDDLEIRMDSESSGETFVVIVEELN